jgi:hypothetical protein
MMQYERNPRDKVAKEMSAIQLKSVSHRHEAIIDWLLANPHIKNLDVLCKEMNIGRSHLSIIMNSDCFRKRLAERRQEVLGSTAQRVYDRWFRIAEKSAEKLDELLSGEQELDPRLVSDIASRAMQNLGLTPQKGSAPVVKETRVEERVMRVDGGVLKEARERITTTMEGPLALPSPQG